VNATLYELSFTIDSQPVNLSRNFDAAIHEPSHSERGSYQNRFESFIIMPTGQTQKLYKNEKALAPETIRDVKQLLDGANPRVEIRNHKIVSGIMFFEVSRAEHIKRRGNAHYARFYLVAGEDPMEEGCIAAMYLSPQNLITVHMRHLWDTRGGIWYVAWCTAFQLQRSILPSGTNSCSCKAIRIACGDYCKALLRSFNDSLTFENQDWNAIQVCHGLDTTCYRANRLQNIIDGRERLFEACRCNECRFERLENGADDGDDRDDDPDLDLDQRRPADNESDEDDYLDDHDDHPGPDLDDDDNDNNSDDNDDADGFDLQRELDLLRRHSGPDSGPENTENDQDDFRDLINMEDDLNGEFDIQDDVDEDYDMIDSLDDRSQSPPLFVPHSRQTSPEVNLDDLSDMDIDRMSTLRSPTRLDSPIQPKLEPKVEPEEEVTIQFEYRRPRRIWDPIDLTEDSDEPTSSRSSTMEMIELTEDAEPARTINRYEDVIDLTQDSEDSQSPMEIIELDD
jgi:hypothetical protein